MALGPPGTVTTVLGPVDPATLGATLMHEHILADVSLPAMRGVPAVEITFENRFAAAYRPETVPGNHRLDDVALMSDEVALYRAAGGGCVVDVSIEGIVPDPTGLAAISRATGVPIVLGCGWYVDDYVAEGDRSLSTDTMVDAMTDWLARGYRDTGVTPGIIGEIGCSWPLTPFERRSLIAGARVAAAHGLALTIHPGRDPSAPFEILEIAAREGLAPDRVVIGHIDRTIFDVATMLELARTGATLEFDFCGIETSRYWAGKADLPTDWMRIAHARALIDAGHGGQVLFSHDICTKGRLARFGGHGYGHILANMVPLMRERGFTSAEIDAILVDTPRRLLTRV